MAATKKGSTRTAARTPTEPRAKSGPAKAEATARPASKSKPTAAPAAKAPAAAKINDRQRALLAKVHAAGPTGYEPGKAEQRSLDALLARKLLKRGAKNKETGAARSLLTRAGEPHLPAAPISPPAPAEPAPSAVSDTPAVP